MNINNTRELLYTQHLGLGSSAPPWVPADSTRLVWAQYPEDGSISMYPSQLGQSTQFPQE